MKQFLKPIELNATGYRISLLHQVLSAFDLPVSATEVSAMKAGEDTQNKVRLLQKQLKVRVDNDSILLDKDSITAILKAMTNRGLLGTEHSFGTVNLT